MAQCVLGEQRQPFRLLGGRAFPVQPGPVPEQVEGQLRRPVSGGALESLLDQVQSPRVVAALRGDPRSGAEHWASAPVGPAENRADYRATWPSSRKSA